MIPPLRTAVALLFFLAYCTVFSHASAERSIELFLQLGHTRPITSVAFSPDGARLASGSFENTINIWDAVSGAIKVSTALLPGNEWIAYHPNKWVYNSSLQGDEYAADRVDRRLSPVYPLKYYRQALKRSDLEQAFSLPQPVIKPQPIRLWWDRVNKVLLIGGLLVGLLAGTAGVTVAFILRKRSDPMEVARQFFVQAGFQRVEEMSRDLLRLYPAGDRMAGFVVLWQEGISDPSEHLLAAVRRHKEGRMGEVTIHYLQRPGAFQCRHSRPTRTPGV